MKRLIITLAAALPVGTVIAVASENVDSLSYAFGHQYTLGTMAGKNEFMQSEQDFRNYIRGLEDNVDEMGQTGDSSYTMSYYLGAREAATMTNGMEYKKKEELPPYPCIVTGLRKVAEGEISLPADTVAAMDFINTNGGDSIKISGLDEETRCKLFTAYGMMKAYQPGLQQYINEMRPGTSIAENRRAYAAGMADILEGLTVPPANAYDIGRLIALSIKLSSVEYPIDYASFLAGAKASLGLGPQLIPRGEVEEIMDREFEQMDESDEDFD